MTSKQPRKQRAARRDEPLHKRHKHVHALLSNELREEYNTRRTRVNEGDTVEVMRGDDAGEEAEVVDVDLKDGVVRVEGVTVEKADGEEIPRPLDASNLRITELDLEDDLREQRLEASGEEDDE
jgi:large subunit ribosomal protein L24